jgi:hypothetical protein
MQTLTVQLAERSYPILIGPGLSADAALLGKHITSNRVLRRCMPGACATR